MKKLNNFILLLFTGHDVGSFIELTAFSRPPYRLWALNNFPHKRRRLSRGIRVGTRAGCTWCHVAGEADENVTVSGGAVPGGSVPGGGGRAPKRASHIANSERRTSKMALHGKNTLDKGKGEAI